MTTSDIDNNANNINSTINDTNVININVNDAVKLRKRFPKRIRPKFKVKIQGATLIGRDRNDLIQIKAQSSLSFFLSLPS